MPLNTNLFNIKNKAKVLRKLVFEGLGTKDIRVDDVVLDRINYELSVIDRMDFTIYFLHWQSIIDI